MLMDDESAFERAFEAVVRVEEMVAKANREAEESAGEGEEVVVAPREVRGGHQGQVAHRARGGQLAHLGWVTYA